MQTLAVLTATENWEERSLLWRLFQKPSNLLSTQPRQSQNPTSQGKVCVSGEHGRTNWKLAECPERHIKRALLLLQKKTSWCQSKWSRQNYPFSEKLIMLSLKMCREQYYGDSAYRMPNMAQRLCSTSDGTWSTRPLATHPNSLHLI